MFSRGEPEVKHDDSGLVCLKFDRRGDFSGFFALNQGMIVVLIGEGSKVRDRPTGDLSLYYWEHLKMFFLRFLSIKK